MHSVIKNLSKVLALVVLFTNFLPSFVSANKTTHNSESLHTTAEPVDAISADEMSDDETSDDERAFREQIKRFETLGQGRFVVAEDFKTQDNYNHAYLMLNQLNDLFKKYPNVLNALIDHATAHGCFYLNKVSPTAHQLIVPPHPWFLYRIPANPTTTVGLTDCYARFMLFNAPSAPTFATIIGSSTAGVTARVDADKYLQAMVSSQFGHLMSVLPCLTNYYATNNRAPITRPAEPTLLRMCDARSQEVRDAIAMSYGHAPYISHSANPVMPTAPLPEGAELTASASSNVDSRYFAELFAYTECNSQAPDDLKKAVREIIDTWFV